MLLPVLTARPPQPDREPFHADDAELLSASDIPGKSFFDSFRDGAPSTADDAARRKGSRARTGIRKALNNK